MKRGEGARYCWQRSDWPKFKWAYEAVAAPLATAARAQGLLLGRMQGLGFALREEATLHALTQDVLKSSEIEGERLDAAQTRSSIARRLGLDVGGLVPASRQVDGVVDMLLDATRGYEQPLTTRRLFAWHAALFPEAGHRTDDVRVGAWRNDRQGPMQVISGPAGRERVHYEAPPATRLESEIAAFLQWFDHPSGIDSLLHAGLAHLWFVTLHPFDDGNGRIARAVTDMALARSELSTQRFYSMSAAIQQQRGAYYEILERTQKGDLNVTGWMEWFLACLIAAIRGAEQALDTTLRKADFWRAHAGSPLNQRQVLVINRLFDGFEGKLTSSKWAKLTKCSQDTASRDINDLLQRRILVRNAAGGRSTSYALASTR